MQHDVFVFIAGMIAGGINSIAGGGTLISFPTLVWLGLPSIAANAGRARAATSNASRRAITCSFSQILRLGLAAPARWRTSTSIVSQLERSHEIADLPLTSWPIKGCGGMNQKTLRNIHSRRVLKAVATTMKC